MIAVCLLATQTARELPTFVIHACLFLLFSVISALRVFALWNRNYGLLLAVLGFGIVPVVTSTVCYIFGSLQHKSNSHHRR